MGRFDQLGRTLLVELQGFFEQHMFARSKALLANGQVRGRGCGHDDGLDLRVSQGFVQCRDHAHWAGVGSNAVRMRVTRHRVTQVDPLRQVLQTAQMRLRGRTQTHQGHAHALAHGSAAFGDGDLVDLCLRLDQRRHQLRPVAQGAGGHQALVHAGPHQ